MDALAEQRRPGFIAVIGATHVDETRIGDPEEFFFTLSYQGDAVAFGETGPNDPENATLPIKGHQLPGMEADEFTARRDDESIMCPRCGGVGHGGEVDPIARELIVG